VAFPRGAWDRGKSSAPTRADAIQIRHKLVVAWIEIHQEDLLPDWNLAANGMKPFPIKGLDQ
jgi:hypothetical protein